MQINTHGFSYRAAYAAWDRLPIWEKTPQRSFRLLRITPQSVEIDNAQLFIEALQIRANNRLPDDEAIIVATHRANRQVQFWLKAIRDALTIAMADYRVARWDRPQPEPMLQAAE